MKEIHMNDAIQHAPADYLDYVVAIARLEQETTDYERATVQMGPYTCFCVVGALQLATRHPEMHDAMRERIQHVIDQLAAMFKGTPAEQIMAQGSRPDFDMDREQFQHTLEDAGPGFDDDGWCVCAEHQRLKAEHLEKTRRTEG